MLGVGVLLDLEVPLNGPIGIGEEGPLGADGGAELLDGVVVVGGDGDDLGVADGHLRIVRRQLEVLLVLLRAVVAPGQGEDQGVVALELTELALRVGVIGQGVVGEGATGPDVGSHGYRLSAGSERALSTPEKGPIPPVERAPSPWPDYPPLP